MQHVYLRMRRGIGHHFFRHALPHGGIGIAEIGIQRDSVEKAPLSADFREHPALAVGQIVVHSLPAVGGNAHAGGRPAVPHRVKDHIALLYFLRDQADKARGVFLRKGLARNQIVPGMRIPAVEELKRRAELDKVAVEPRLRRPLDEVEHVLQRGGALDGDAAVPARRRDFRVNVDRFQRHAGNHLAGLPRAEKAAPAAPQKIVYSEQQRARAVRPDAAAPARNVDRIMLFQERSSVFGKESDRALLPRHAEHIIGELTLA